jgi:hypothetical protein
MRYAAAEKLEIIRLVEQSPLPVRHTLAKLGIPRATFYRWYDRHSRGGPEALNDRSSAVGPDRGPRFRSRGPDFVNLRFGHHVVSAFGCRFVSFINEARLSRTILTLG